MLEDNRIEGSSVESDVQTASHVDAQVIYPVRVIRDAQSGTEQQLQQQTSRPAGHQQQTGIISVRGMLKACLPFWKNTMKANA